jgi:hypothetical protein
MITLIISGKTLICPAHEPTHSNATSIGHEKCAPAILGNLILT